MSSSKEIAGILLAGGSSTRLGKPKQMVTWQGDYLINHMIGIIHKGGIDCLHVILGYQYQEIRRIINDPNVQIIHNNKWESGISSSIKAGITSFKDGINGLFIFVVDQPFLDETLIRKMKDIFYNGNADIVVPRVMNQQCNPVLFRNSLFKELLSIQGDRGGKSLIEKHCTYWVDWEDERLLLDIDIDKDYFNAESLI